MRPFILNIKMQISKCKYQNYNAKFKHYGGWSHLPDNPQSSVKAYQPAVKEKTIFELLFVILRFAL